MAARKLQLPPALTPLQFRTVFPPLYQWTQMAAHAYGAYAGINEAISLSKEKWPSSAHLATDYRQELVLMAALRSFAVMDATSRVSFQSVYQLMKYANPLGFLQQRLVEQGNYHTHMVKRASEDARCSFIASYEAIDWVEVAGLQRFRNTALAHATFEEFSQSVTYGALERLVHLQCEMCHQLNLLYKGSAEHPIERLNHARAISSNFWFAVIKADADKTLDW